MEGYVYIIQSVKTNRYYVGSTIDLERRFYDHNHKNTPSTKFGIPWILKFCQKFNTLQEARTMEKRIKRLKSKVVLEKIIAEGIVK